jgi:hypothetical protein
MKKIFLVFILALLHYSIGQSQIKPSGIGISYFAEVGTHPGFRLFVDYEKNLNPKVKNRKGLEKTIQRSFVLRPTLGYFHHKAYQNSFFVLPELGYQRVNHKGTLFSYGIGMGYMRSQIPQVYQLNQSGEVEKTRTGHNRFATSIHLGFGKDLSVRKSLPISWMIKPQYWRTFPNTKGGIAYFFLEAGIAYHL